MPLIIMRGGHMSQNDSMEIKAEDLYNFLNGLSSTQLSLLQKVARAGTKEQFFEFLQTGEPPCVKLNADEIQSLQGGSYPPIDLNLGAFLKELSKPKLGSLSVARATTISLYSEKIYFGLEARPGAFSEKLNGFSIKITFP
jgi:hypothetical protein